MTFLFSIPNCVTSLEYMDSGLTYPLVKACIRAIVTHILCSDWCIKRTPGNYRKKVDKLDLKATLYTSVSEVAAFSAKESS